MEHSFSSSAHGKTLGLGLAFSCYSFPSPQLKRLSALERLVLPAVPKARSVYQRGQLFASCQPCASTQSDEINVTNRQARQITCRLKGLFSPPSGSVIKIILVINVYTAPILFQNQLLSSATQVSLERRMRKQLPHLLRLILKGQGLYLRFS